ncbi:MAG: hypothetical protein QGI33_02735, partial [Candidatus Brocadiia bacterium]|nr:hypothetical protein [Candidatus Brocadiia bacterium]
KLFAVSVIREVNLLQGESICMWDNALQELPTYVASLKPRTLYITPNIVIIHLGGEGLPPKRALSFCWSQKERYRVHSAAHSERSVLKYSVDRSGMLLSPQELAAMKDYEAVVPPEEKDESSVRERLSFL